MKDMISKKEVHQFLTELHNIARELNVPLDDPKVMVAYEKKFHGYSIEISDTVVQPIYFPPECSKVLSPL